MSTIIRPGQGDFFVQEDCLSPFEHLTCTGVGDLPQPRGDLTPIYEPDQGRKGGFHIVGFIQGEAGAGNTTLRRPLMNVANWLLERNCPFNGWVTYACRGVRGDPTNYEVGFILLGCQITNTNVVEAAVAATPEERDRINTSAEISYQARVPIYPLAVSLGSITGSTDLNTITFLPETCLDECGGRPRERCTEGYIGGDGELYNSLVLKSINGDAWTDTISDPFTYSGGDVSSAVVVETASGHRIIVARGSVATGDYAEIAYSDDEGATWSNIYVGTVADQVINRLVYHQGVVWAAASGGYIYRSTNLGQSWIVSESGIETTDDLNDLVMYSPEIGYAVGDDNSFLYTIDGATWDSRTGPAAGADLLSVAVNKDGDVFVGASDGVLYGSADGGLTWQTVSDFGAGQVVRVKFDAQYQYFGALLHNAASGVGRVYRSRDGGATWEAIANQSGTWNSGLNDLFICDQNHLMFVGNMHDRAPVFGKVGPA